MTNFLIWIKNILKYILADFMSQIFAAIILITAFISWIHFSSVTAGIIVLLTGILLWIFIIKLLQRNKGRKQ